MMGRYSIEDPASAVGVAVASGPPAPMVKLAFEMSKKMLPAHSTLMRADEVASLGTVMLCEPSLAVLSAKVWPKVVPPSVESKILTEEQLTGAAVVLATSQVTLCWLPPAHVTAVLGAVTANGPASLLTFKVVWSLLTPPPPAWLSRTVKRKVRVRVVVGRYSPSFDKSPLKMVSSLGKIRLGLEVGL